MSRVPERAEASGRVALGCVADDYTGGTDVAAALRRAGLRTVLSFGPPVPGTVPPSCEAIVVALKTRTAPVGEAVARTLDARRRLAELGAARLYFKYCSTFDSTDEGNIGPVADAILDDAGVPLTVVCPAAPEHGRTVYQGHLFVRDRLLSESSMKDHPLTPMTDPDLVRVLGRQTPHPVGLLPHATVRDGAAAVRDALDALRRQGVRYAVADAVSDGDLAVLAAGSAHLPVVTGAAGLAGAIAAVSRDKTDTDGTDDTAALPTGPGIVLAGSCSQTTLAQVEAARAAMPSYRVDPARTPDRDGLIAGARAWLDAHAGGGPVMVYSSADAAERADSPLGPAAGAILEDVLARAAEHAVGLGYRRIVVAGGETSGAVLDRLGVRSVVVAEEEDRGVPWCRSTGGPELALLLKSGNFGREDLLVRAIGGHR
ncbi:3-oxo-tetronate kinase [Actinomadura sp. WAC 06369]|uniref:3-oxo-tetronate kinase n=1 Tax=Actinomadura sp. WAC 06369 TaxID=2203193 RepID=UPI0018F6D105|nr:3-oxo-tetronate kinase [Actinomadura sp. WAC 06369]